MFDRLAQLIFAGRWWLLIVMLAVLVVGVVWGPGVVHVLAPGGFQVEGDEHDRTTELLDTEFDEHSSDIAVVYRHPSRGWGDPLFGRQVSDIAERVRDLDEVSEVRIPQGRETPLVSRDRRSVVIVVSLVGDDTAKLEAFARVVEELRDTELDTQVGGRIAAYVTAQEVASSDLVRAELIALPALFVLLLWFFRSVVAAVLPVVIGAVSIVSAMLVLRGLAMVTDISLLSLNVVAFLGLGLAVDYSLFMVRRHREEMQQVTDVVDALRRSVRTAGRTIVFSGVAVAASLLGLLWFDIPLLRSIAIGGTVITLMTLVVSLVFLPALLALVGRRLNAWRVGRSVPETRQAGFWYRLAYLVMRRPVLVALAVTAALLVVASPVRRIEIEAGDAGLLPHRTEVRQVWDVLSHSEQFETGEFNPVEVVVQSETSLLTAEGMGKLYDYAHAVEDLPVVERVHSVVTSGQERPRTTYQALPQMLGTLPAEVQQQVRSVLHERHALLRVVLAAPPSSDEARAALEDLRSLAPEEFEVHLAGRTVIADELHEELATKGVAAFVTIASVTFVVLFLAFGSFVLPIKAILMNLLSVGASYGVLVWVFQDGRLEGLLNYESPGAIDPTILAVTFAIMFGLSMDYEVFLLSRIREEYDETGDNERAVALGLGSTGRVITGAALILMAVVAGFVAGKMIFIKELGVGMAVAVLVDATIVRALLVPSTMRVMGRWNWWAPGPLGRWWRRSGVGVEEKIGPPLEPTP